MRFGFMMPFQNPPRWARPHPELYREYIEQTVLASAFPLLKEAGDLRKDRAMGDAPSLVDLQKIDPGRPGGSPMIGTVDDCVRATESYRQGTRLTDLALGMHLPGLAPGKIRQSMTLFAREVMPHFK